MDYSDYSTDYGSMSDYGSYGSYDSSGDAGAAAAGLLAGMGAIGLVGAIIAFVVWLALVVLMLWVGSKYYKKMGYSPWIVLLQLVPLVNVGMFFYFAFVEWPVEKNSKELASGKKE